MMGRSLHLFPFFQMCFIRRAIAYMYLYPNVINVDAVDFSECSSTEALKFLLTLSV